MTIQENHMKKAMDNGKLAVALNVNRWRTVDIAAIAKTTGYEWLFLDLEHSLVNEEMACQMAIAALGVGVTPIARVGTDQFYQAARLLDGGMQGIIFPHVDTVEQAERAAQATKYPPMGARSLTGPLAQANFRNAADPVLMQAMNDHSLTIVMVETQTALDNVEAIARVKGVDAILIGSNDLAADLGMAGKIGDQKIADAYAKVAKATKASGKYFGMGGVYSKDIIARYLKAGVQFMLGGADVGFMMEGAKARREMIASLG